MFSTSKTDYDSLGTAVADAFDDSTDRNCAHTEWDTGRTELSVQYLVPGDDREPRLNAANLDEQARERLLDVVLADRRQVFDSGPQYVVFVSRANTHLRAAVEIEMAAQAAAIDDVQLVELSTYRAAPGTSVADLLNRVREVMGLN